MITISPVGKFTIRSMVYLALSFGLEYEPKVEIGGEIYIKIGDTLVKTYDEMWNKFFPLIVAGTADLDILLQGKHLNGLPLFVITASPDKVSNITN